MKAIHTRIALGSVLLLLGGYSAAQTEARKTNTPEVTNSPVETYTATAENLAGSDASTRLRIQVFHWSSPEDRDRLIKAFQGSPDEFDKSLAALPSIGYIWTDESSLGYSVHYAERERTPNGGERITLATDKPLGSWVGKPWTPKTGAASNYPFTIVELVLTNGGRGDGKLSLNAKVSANDKNLGLEDSAAPLLRNVQHVRN